MKLIELCHCNFASSNERSTQASRAAGRVTLGVGSGTDRKRSGAGHSGAEAGVGVPEAGHSGVHVRRRVVGCVGSGQDFTASIHQGNVLLPVVICLSFRSVQPSLMVPARGITGQKETFSHK